MATRKKSKRAKSPARRANGGSAPDAMPQDVEIMVASDGGLQPFMPNEPIEVVLEDGTVEIDLNPGAAEPKEEKFEDNIAETLAETSDGQLVLGQIATTLLEAIDQDERDRAEWIQQRSDGLELLGQKVEKPGTGNVGTSSTAVPGQSTVRDSLLSEACDQFQANAFAELCPSEGPVKVVNYGKETTADDSLAHDFEKDLNFYLTGSGPGTAKEYYPDTRKMLWWTGYASGMFKKVYKCPLRERPVSESVDGSDLIVPSNATDLSNAARITHQINMSAVTLRQMQLQGAYRDVTLTQPTPHPNALLQKEADVTGMALNMVRENDRTYTIYECYCNLHVLGHEYKRGGKDTGLPVPYRVVIDKDSRTVLEIRRNWDAPPEDDPDQLPKARIPFVLFPYATGLGFYGTGLLHRLGNYSMALTAMLRECIDAGMFASFPGFLFAKPLGRQLQNDFRVPPGGGAPIDVSAVGGDIQKAVMPLPYKDPSAALVQLMAQTGERAFRYGGMANTGVAEGKQDAPVGTTLALIEQATKIEGGVHKALHAAQKEELQLLKELFRDDPEALWRGNRRPAMGATQQIRLARFKQALEDTEMVPASDPNVPSRMHRLAKATTYLQAASMVPGLFDMKKVFARWGAMVEIDDITDDFAPQQDGPPPEQQLAMAQVALKAKDLQIKEAGQAAKAQEAQAARQSKEQIAAAQIAAKMADGGEVPTGPDPAEAQRAAEQMQFERAKWASDLHLKQQKLHLDASRLGLDAHDNQAERDSRESIEAMKIAQTAGVHPESTGVMDEQMHNLNAFLEPAAATATRSTANGGRIEGEGYNAGGASPAKQEPQDPGDAADEFDNLPGDIAEALRLAKAAAGMASSVSNIFPPTPPPRPYWLQ